MKKLLSCLMAVLFVAAALSGCGPSTAAVAGQATLDGQAVLDDQVALDDQAADSPSASAEQSAAQKLSIVATTFPQYDWIRQILGDKVNDVTLTLLLDDGVDLHSYQPTVEDIAVISTCDLFVHVGGESDGWVHDALATATNKDMVVINMMEALGDKVAEEEIVEGMEHDHDHGHSHGAEIDPDHIGDRPLSYYAGDWATIENALASGAMDDYVAENAAENETDFDSQMAAYQARWRSDYPAFQITEDGLTIDGSPVSYQYAGYEVVEGDDSVTVWYGYEATDALGIAPKYIAFNDHTAESAESHDHDEEHGDEHAHEEEKLAHFHMRYGDESLAALAAVEGWAPTYFLANMTDEEVAEAMSGHSHGEAELDEHVWLSLANAQSLCGHIADQLGALDTANAALYAENAQAYATQLAELNSAYQSAVNTAPVKTLLFGDRFPFRYLVDDYGLDYYAAFSGCSAETEASFETIVFLANKLDELALKHVMVTESADQSIANTIVENTQAKDQTILVLNSMQSVTAQDISAGASYLGIMAENLDVLKAALS